MRITLGHKLAVVVGLLGLVAVGISAFALRQSEQARQRAASTEAVWDAALQARTLATRSSTRWCGRPRSTRLGHAGSEDLSRGAAGGARRGRAGPRPFLAAADAQLTPERKRRLDLAVGEFLAYQTETAEMV